EEAGDELSRVWALQVSGLHAMQRSLADVARPKLLAAVEAYRKLGARRRLEEVLHMSCVLSLREGDWRRALVDAEELLDSTREREDRQTEAWGRGNVALAHLLAGDTSRAIDSLDRVHARLDPERLPAECILVLGLRASAAAVDGEFELVESIADEVAGALERAPVAYNAIEGYAGLAEAALLWLDAEPAETRPREICTAALRCLSQTAVAMAPGLSGYALWLDGRSALLCGRQRRARRLLRRSVSRCDAAGLAVVAARARLDLARLGGADAPQLRAEGDAALARLEVSTVGYDSPHRKARGERGGSR
ncbi:MAG: hypothetical protein R3190_13285, partial [Thermoanaerobaculia bacterium]|nr:hypothetical protein [Thermoanaerobaculia bacterium]